MSNNKKRRTAVKVTRVQLLEAVSCCQNRNHKLIKTHWPKHRKKVTLAEFVEKAREVGVDYFNIQYMLWKLDRYGWNKTEKGGNICTTTRCRDLVNKYLELFEDAKGG